MWRFDEYSEWARQLARSSSVKELAARLAKLEKARERAKNSHLRAVLGTSSMSGRSQQRAQSRASLVTTYAEYMAVSDALELHRLFPEQVAHGRG